MQPLFKKTDFQLCQVPVPSGYPQSQTHSGVALYEGKYYLTVSPYPSHQEKLYKVLIKTIMRKLSCDRLFPVVRSESYENPCLYIQSEDGGIPTHFKLMQQHPLMDTPDDYYGLPAFNSDPDIFIEDGIIYVLNRVVYRTKLCPGEPLNKYDNRIYLISGEIDKERFKLDRILRLHSSDKQALVSPCFFKYNNKYYLLVLETNSYNDGESFEGLYKITSEQVVGLKDNNNWEKIIIENIGDFIPWHISTFQYQSRLYAIVACIKKGKSHRCWQMFGAFNKDLSFMKLYHTPLTDYKSYRGAACVTQNGEFVLYSTTVHEAIQGSNSVDGRDVIMAHMPFDLLLRQLRANE